MIYLSQMLGKPVIDASDEEIGTISDIAIATGEVFPRVTSPVAIAMSEIVTGEVFPRVTSLAFQGPDKTPFMLSWRKFACLPRQSRVPDVRMRPLFRGRGGGAGLRRINQHLLAPLVAAYAWRGIRPPARRVNR